MSLCVCIADMEAISNAEASNSTAKLCLQWHHHHKTLVSLLDTLWQKQELVDVTLATDGKFIHVHRVVLCASSDYFQVIVLHCPVFLILSGRESKSC